MWRLGRGRLLAFLVMGTTVVALLVWFGLRQFEESSATPDGALVQEVEAAEDPDKIEEPLREDKREISDEDRAELLTRAHVWRQPRTPIARAPLGGETLEEVECKFKVSELGGTTPKFDCELNTGEEIRIKYGNGPEVPAEAAATRLLKALGFGADDVTLVRTLRCYGCPKEPFSTMKAVGITQAEGLYKHVIDFSEYETFEWVGLERKYNARPVETDKLEGWSFFELDAIDASKGGAPRAHVDAIRLVAVLLAHWDNKAENQRLVCLSRTWEKKTPCAQPFLLLQDVGATFGPTKLDLEAWEKVSVWEDRASCAVSMHGLPFGGATFGRARITEEGRQFLGRLLSQLTDRQLTDLFDGARFGEKRGMFSPTHRVADWVRVFKAKVRSITAGPACPAV